MKTSECLKLIFRFVDHVARQIRTDLAEPGYEKIPDVSAMLKLCVTV